MSKVAETKGKQSAAGSEPRVKAAPNSRAVAAAVTRRHRDELAERLRASSPPASVSPPIPRDDVENWKAAHKEYRSAEQNALKPRAFERYTNGTNTELTLQELLPQMIGDGEDVAEAALRALAVDLDNLLWNLHFNDELTLDPKEFLTEVLDPQFYRLIRRAELAAELHVRVRDAAMPYGVGGVPPAEKKVAS